MKKIFLSVIVCFALTLTACSLSKENKPEGYSKELDSFLEAVRPVLAYENLTLTQGKDCVIVEFWYDGLSNGVSLAKSGNEQKLELWEKYVEIEQRNCETFGLLLEDGGFPRSVILNVMDDLDKESILLSIVDGEVIYNSVG